MTLNEKIERMRELLAKHDDIERELGELLGGGDGTPAAPTKTTKSPKQNTSKTPPKRNAKVCKKCGKPGHMAKTCTAPTAATPTFGDKALLTEDQFDELKHIQSIGELISKDFAFERDLALSEVNRAITSRNYEAYSNS